MIAEDSRNAPQNTRIVAVGRSEEIGIIDLDTLRALTTWLAAHTQKSVNGVDTCRSSMDEHPSPPALTSPTEIDRFESSLGSGDRAADSTTSAASSCAGSGQVADRKTFVDPLRVSGGQR